MVTTTFGHLPIRATFVYNDKVHLKNSAYTGHPVRAMYPVMIEEHETVLTEESILLTAGVIASVSFTGRSAVLVEATLDTGVVITLFTYYEDELQFSSSELVGRTVEQALALRHEKDVAYLRS